MQGMPCEGGAFYPRRELAHALERRDFLDVRIEVGAEDPPRGLAWDPSGEWLAFWTDHMVYCVVAESLTARVTLDLSDEQDPGRIVSAGWAGSSLVLQRRRLRARASRRRFRARSSRFRRRSRASFLRFRALARRSSRRPSCTRPSCDLSARAARGGRTRPTSLRSPRRRCDASSSTTPASETP